jgi:phosphoribosylamine--glycine ligase
MDIQGITDFCTREKIDLAVVAPDDPLNAGMVDALEASGIRAFGPSKAAALIEGSKAFAKELMKKYSIPTAGYEIFDDREAALKYLDGMEFPAVIKADGLALGKGVIIAEDIGQAKDAINAMMGDKVFGGAGDRIVIEEFLRGPEVSILAFTDGSTIVPMVSSQDHKRALDNDKGLNTGGMGTFSPSRIYDENTAAFCMKNIFRPTIEAMNKEGRKFKGVLYFGLMLTAKGPKLLEYNARFGDPETQVILPRLKNDIVDIFDSIIDERLNTINIEWMDNAAVCVVAASGGYPQKYGTGFEITGIKDAEKEDGITIFHAGTRKENSKYFTTGGRVLGVTAVGGSLEEAIRKAYEAVGRIHFKDMHYRKDIGVK